MESICITGQFKVECELDDGVRWVFAVRHFDDEDTDVYFLKFKDAFLYRKCNNSQIVNYKTNINADAYASAVKNSERLKTLL